MILFRKKKNPNTICKFGEDSAEIIAAKEYLNKTHPTLSGRGEGSQNKLFNYLESQANGKYTRHYFREGLDDRIIFVVLCEEEREKIIELFNEGINRVFDRCFDEEFKPYINKYYGDFIYKDSLKGSVTGAEVLHRFYSSKREVALFMSEDGYIRVPITIFDIEVEDME